MKTFIGNVVSLKTPKTITIEIVRTKINALYKKRMRFAKKIKVHYEGKDLAIGSTVKIVETRPISKDKHFKVLEIVKK